MSKMNRMRNAIQLATMACNADAGFTKEQTDELAQVLGMYAFSVCEAGTMVVVRTGAGHAQIVAVGLDRSGLEEAVGTLAGGDTIFIATKSGEAAGRV